MLKIDLKVKKERKQHYSTNDGVFLINCVLTETRTDEQQFITNHNDAKETITIHNDPQWSKRVHNNPKRPKIIRNGPIDNRKQFTTTQDDPQYSIATPITKEFNATSSVTVGRKLPHCHTAEFLLFEILLLYSRVRNNFTAP